MSASDSGFLEVKESAAPPLPEAPIQSFERRRPWLAVVLGVALPGLYLAWWHATITEQMRVYGRCKEDGRLSAATPGARLWLSRWGGCS